MGEWLAVGGIGGVCIGMEKGEMVACWSGLCLT